MTNIDTLRARAGNTCELCAATDNLDTYPVPPDSDGTAARTVLACFTCRTQLADPEQVAPNHWRGLNDAMWSEVPAVKVVAYRMLHRLRSEGWPQDLLDMMYLDEETLAWAKSGLTQDDAIVHLDANGNVLEAGDTVVLIKDLKVKGANFTAKRGTSVRRISLVHDNPGQIEGRVEDQHIVILTEFVKKSK